jgi:S1-C subfamily serine protease
VSVPRYVLKGLVLSVLIFLTGCLTRPVERYQVQAPAVDVADLTAKSVVLLEEDDKGGGDIFCSGVWVGTATIATAEHCVRDVKLGTQVSFATKADIFGGDLHEKSFTPWASVLWSRDSDHDVALLKVIGLVPPHGVARIASDLPGQGTQVHTMGAPMGQGWSYSRGEVAALRYTEGHSGKEILTIQATAPISPGNSGGALFNDAGELLGICRATYTFGQNLNLFTAAQYVDALMKVK